MRLSAQERMKISAELEDISKDIEVDDFEESIPDELKADEEFDLELDNANPMMAEDEDDIEQLELEDEEKGDKEMLADDEEVEKIQMEELDDDPVVNVADIVKAADDEGNIKLSCIKALADETIIPDDKQDDDIVACSKKSSIEKPGIEDKIGNEANGGDPSVSELKKIISHLDICADGCQNNGRRQLAYRIDKVSNTLEGYLKIKGGKDMRKRLTSKQLFAENRKDGLFPGDIGNEERDEKYYDVKEFNNEASEFKFGWDLAEKYDIEDERDEMNFGIHKDVKAYNVARRAIMLAHMFLGPKASEKQIEYQASQFMKMGAKGVAASIKLWKATEDVPEETEEVEKTACDEVKVEDKEACKACEDAPAAPVDETKTAGETCEETPADEKVKTDLTDAEDTIAKEEKNDVSELEACDDETEPALEVEVTPEVAPFETDLTVDEVKPDPTLEAIFAGEEVALPEEKPTEKTASKKGISHMAQPKLNPNKDENEVKKLSMIWTDLAVPNNL